METALLVRGTNAEDALTRLDSLSADASRVLGPSDYFTVRVDMWRGSIKGMIEAVDLFQKLAGPDTWLIPGHGTLVRVQDLLPYRAMLVDILAKVKTLRDQGKSLKEVLAAHLTEPYDKTTQGDTQASTDRFITEVYDEVKDFPPIVNGKRAMPRHPL